MKKIIKLVKLFVLVAFIGFISILGIGLYHNPLFTNTLVLVPIISEDVISRVNQERIGLGLSPLTYNSVLEKAAQRKAEDMCERQYWSHYAPNEEDTPWDFIKNNDYDYSVAGENLARDFTEIDTMVIDWMNSPTHKVNIVNPKFTETGIGLKRCVMQSIDTILIVQLFASSY